MRYIIMLMLMLCSSSVWAQVNAEFFRGEMPHARWAGSLGTDLRFSSGNVNLRSYALEGRLDYGDSEDFHFFVLGDAFQGKTNGEVFDERGFLHARMMQNMMLFYKASVWGEMFAQSQYDRRKDLSLRQLTGTGLRWQYEVFRVAFAVGAGAMLEYERLKSLGGGTGTVVRSTNYLSVGYVRDFFAEDTKAVLVAYYQPLYKDPSDFRVKVDLTAFTNFAVRWIQIGPSVTYAYDSRPPEGVQRQDVIVGFKLKFTFKTDPRDPRLNRSPNDP